jgi:hypothetical protein
LGALAKQSYFRAIERPDVELALSRAKKCAAMLRNLRALLAMTAFFSASFDFDLF